MSFVNHAANKKNIFMESICFSNTNVVIVCLIAIRCLIVSTINFLNRNSHPMSNIFVGMRTVSFYTQHSSPMPSIRQYHTVCMDDKSVG